MKFSKKKQQEEMPKVSEIKKKQQFSKTTLFFFVLCILCFIALFTGGYFFYQYKRLKTQLSTTQLNADQAKQLLNNVGKLILLPKDSPVIYTVTDVEKLKTQPFFYHTENGDRLLLYPKEQEAFLYRPSQNMLINVGPIASTPPQQQQSFKPATTQKVTLGLLNGTPVGGVTTKVATTLQQLNPQPIIAFRRQANKTNYPTTTIVVIHSQAEKTAQTIASILHAAITPLPTGEVASSGIDILIIVGADKEHE